MSPEKINYGPETDSEEDEEDKEQIGGIGIGIDTDGDGITPSIRIGPNIGIDPKDGSITILIE